MIVNGGREYRQPTGGLAGQVDSHLALFCIHGVNRVNSRNGSAMMTSPLTVTRRRRSVPSSIRKVGGA